MATRIPENTAPPFRSPLDWRTIPALRSYYTGTRLRPSSKSLALAGFLFVVTLCSCLVAGTQFAVAFAHNESVSVDEFVHAFKLLYQHPAALLGGLSFAITLMTILLAHELGHFFACRHHHIRTSYPFFIPAPTLIGTFGAFILLRSPIRNTRALFDVGASGPFVGFLFAIPALIYGVMNAKIVPGIADPANSDVIFGVPLILHILAKIFHPGVAVNTVLLHPVGRAAWVGLFATSLNLLPAGQLDGGHILRSLSVRTHRLVSAVLPVLLLLLGFFRHWTGWYIWAALLFGFRFLRSAPVYDDTPLDPDRRFAAALALLIFLLCFMPAPISNL
ncbi:MAG: site-2 protease family protein [Acidobacteriota bacterium]|nr:site-2 protease family protein [Acidobacteriota bacterium]